MGLPDRDPLRWRVLPFDHAASLRLQGVPGRIAQGAITIGPEAAFIATGIGYGFAEDLPRPIPVEDPTKPETGGSIIPLPGAAPGPFIPRDLQLRQLPPRALVDGFRLSPRARPLVFELDPDLRVIEEPEQLRFRTDTYAWGRVGELLQRIRPAGQLSFLLSIVDSATGRELQDEPIHNLAALGRADGQRPFRPLSRPMAFLPRSTIRLQVIERERDRTGVLDIVLFGFKVPAGSGMSEAIVRSALSRQPPETAEHWGQRVIPFDYVAQLPLTGVPGEEHETELAINVEGSFVATAISYALDTAEQPATLNVQPITHPPAGAVDIRNAPGNSTFKLGEVTLERFSSDALLDGIRLRPAYARLAFDNGGNLSAGVRVEIANDLFERLNRPESVAFRYRLFDGGAGRDLQNQPIFSVAGLGIADGQRPFKRLPRPLNFEPRSTFRVTVQEITGRGMLHLVLQGYKRLDGRASA
jgi:hypothetical protein